jgi:hypothetical protein
MEEWKQIRNFTNYSISDLGRVRAEKSGRILALSQNQYGVVQVGLLNHGVQYHRSVALLVAKAFLPKPKEAFDTPINLDGDRNNNQLSNLEWRPRWFAIKYNQQFKRRFLYPIVHPIEDIKTGEIIEGSFEAAKRYGLLEAELVYSIMRHTYVWPTYQEFRIAQE